MDTGAIFGIVIGGIFGGTIVLALLINFISFLVDKYRDWRDAPERERMERERAERREIERQRQVARKQEADFQKTSAPLTELYKNYNDNSFTVKVPSGKAAPQTLIESALTDSHTSEELQQFKNLLQKGISRWTLGETEFVKSINKNISDYLGKNSTNDQTLTVAQFKTALNAALQAEPSERGDKQPERMMMRKESSVAEVKEEILMQEKAPSIIKFDDSSSDQDSHSARNNEFPEIGGSLLHSKDGEKQKVSEEELEHRKELMKEIKKRVMKERSSATISAEELERRRKIMQTMMDKYNNRPETPKINDALLSPDNVSLIMLDNKLNSGRDQTNNFSINIQRPQSAVEPTRKRVGINVTYSQIHGERTVAPNTGSFCGWC